MKNRGYKALTILVMLIFFFSCTKSVIYVAPQEEIRVSSSRRVIVMLKDGSEVELKKPRVQNGKIVGLTKKGEIEEIAISSVYAVKIEKTEKSLTFLYAGVGIVAGILIIGAATAPEPPPSESCPFIYSFDGENYVFDAEPYGAAICQNLKRAEWCPLEHVKEIDGQYKILIANELEETQYTDEAKIFVIDHPEGTKVAPDAFGRIHTIAKPLSPIRAIDGKGNDIVPIIAKKDNNAWQTPMEKRSPYREEDLRDELIIEFPKPKGVKKAKLYVNACTSLWGSRIAKQFLELHGNKIDEWYDEVNNFGPAYQQVMNWFFNEELYLLRLRIKTDDGWKSKGTIFGGGPFISEDKAYTIDISDVSEDTLKVKLTPPAAFWMIDSLSVDYTQDPTIHIYELNATRAVNKNGRDERKTLEHTDDDYLVMPDKGDWTEVIFKAPPKAAGLERSVILKATGYYDIHLKAEGEPQHELLDKFHSEPGFTIRFAMEEFQKAQIMSRTKK